MSGILDPVGLRPLVVDEDQHEFPDPIELVFNFELLEGVVVSY